MDAFKAHGFDYANATSLRMKITNWHGDQGVYSAYSSDLVTETMHLTYHTRLAMRRSVVAGGLLSCLPHYIEMLLPEAHMNAPADFSIHPII